MTTTLKFHYHIILASFSFNFPRVSAQLERLMGTNVVRLTDPKYMSDLRRRTIEDYHKMLLERIENRKVSTTKSVKKLRKSFVCMNRSGEMHLWMS